MSNAVQVGFALFVATYIGLTDYPVGAKGKVARLFDKSLWSGRTRSRLKGSNESSFLKNQLEEEKCTGSSRISIRYVEGPKSNWRV